jgi:quinol monooxygenase YgiN
MIALTAVFRARAGEGEALARALAEITDHVGANEPGTLGFYVVRDQEEPLRFITYERFRDHAALEAHNGSAYRDRWIARYGALIDGGLTRYVGVETAATQR